MAIVKSRFSSSISSSTLQRADRVQRRGRLVEQDHLGPGRDGARDAQALLLAARQAAGRGGQPVLHLRPERRAGERPFDALVHLRAAQPLVQAHPEGDVVVDRHRERRRLLEHHADAAAQRVEVDARVDDVGAVHHHLPLGALARVEVVHPVQHPQQGGLAAAGRADHAGDLPGRQVERDRLERPVGRRRRNRGCGSTAGPRSSAVTGRVCTLPAARCSVMLAMLVHVLLAPAERRARDDVERQHAEGDQQGGDPGKLHLVRVGRPGVGVDGERQAATSPGRTR